MGYYDTAAIFFFSFVFLIFATPREVDAWSRRSHSQNGQVIKYKPWSMGGSSITQVFLVIPVMPVQDIGVMPQKIGKCFWSNRVAGLQDVWSVRDDSWIIFFYLLSLWTVLSSRLTTVIKDWCDKLQSYKVYYFVKCLFLLSLSIIFIVLFILPWPDI